MLGASTTPEGNAQMDDGELTAALTRIEKRLDWIEENLTRQVGLQYVAMGRSDHRPDETPIPDDVVSLARAGKTKDAIMRYRELTGVDFNHARDVIAGL